ncbi:hypothetical protein BH11VER1_BH11VER1_11460 [soil metagenome]
MTRFKVFRMLSIIAAVFAPLLLLSSFIIFASGNLGLNFYGSSASLLAVILFVLPNLCVHSDNETDPAWSAKKIWIKVGREAVSLVVFMWLINQPEIRALFERVIIRERPLWKWYFMVSAVTITGYFIVFGLRKSLRLRPSDLFPQPSQDRTA